VTKNRRKYIGRIYNVGRIKKHPLKIIEFLYFFKTVKEP